MCVCKCIYIVIRVLERYAMYALITRESRALTASSTNSPNVLSHRFLLRLRSFLASYKKKPVYKVCHRSTVASGMGG